MNMCECKINANELNKIFLIEMKKHTNESEIQDIHILFFIFH